MNAPATYLTSPALADRDQRLLETARQGDLDAFEALVRRHQRRVYSLAWHGVRDQMLAEEIAQDVFMQLHAALPRIESAAHLGAWLRRTTSHRVIDTLRVRRMPRSLDEIAEPHVGPRRERPAGRPPGPPGAGPAGAAGAGDRDAALHGRPRADRDRRDRWTCP